MYDLALFFVLPFEWFPWTWVPIWSLTSFWLFFRSPSWYCWYNSVYWSWPELSCITEGLIHMTRPVFECSCFAKSLPWSHSQVGPHPAAFEHNPFFFLFLFFFNPRVGCFQVSTTDPDIYASTSRSCKGISKQRSVLFANALSTFPDKMDKIIQQLEKVSSGLQLYLTKQQNQVFKKELWEVSVLHQFQENMQVSDSSHLNWKNSYYMA